MSKSTAARSAVAGALVVVGAAVLGLLGHPSLAAAPSPASSPVSAAPLAPPAHGALPRDRHRALGEADGVVPDGTTVFDDVPAVSHLDPALLGAIREAARDAAGDGLTFYVNSGWRTPAYQEHLLDQAVATYGSRAEAARWVATPTTSPHVSGEAVDIGHSDATRWLSEHGSAYGLCQIYDNEPWHYELRPDAVDHGCPPTYADPTHDPRMQQ
jgi:zinc D-Ala-D-Ala carboxypeptidase